MASPHDGKRRTGRPRNDGLDHLILTATIELLAAGGEPAAALDDVAARAGVGKATIYRRWATKRELILDAAISCLPIDISSADRGSLDADARALLTDLVALLGAPQGLAARQLLPQLSSWPELTDPFRDGVLRPWQTALRSVSTRAHARGDIADPAPVQLALEAAASHICLQWLVHPGTVTEHDPTSGGRRIEDLVSTLITPPRRR